MGETHTFGLINGMTMVLSLNIGMALSTIHHFMQRYKKSSQMALGIGQFSFMHIPIPNAAIVENRSDSYSWSLSNDGKFSFKHTWEHLRKRKRKIEWHNAVWFKNHTPKHAFITWTAMHDRLTTKFRMLTRGIEINSNCIFCNFACETRDHLFFHCSFTRRIWQRGLELTCIKDPPTSWNEILTFFTPYVLEGNLKATLIKHFFGATIYFIWLERNNRQFSNGAKTEEQIFSSIFNHVRIKCSIGKLFTSSCINKIICKNWGIEAILE